MTINVGRVRQDVHGFGGVVILQTMWRVVVGWTLLWAPLSQSLAP